MAKLTVFLNVFLFALVVSAPGTATDAGGPSRLVSVPALGVRGDGLPGLVHYILIQFDRTAA